MQPYLEVFLVALLAVTLLTPGVRALALRGGAVAAPGGRHVHAAPVPRLGGAAIFGGFILSIAFACIRWQGFANLYRAEGLRTVGVLVGCAAMAALGFVDDRWGLRAIYKLAAQVAVAVFAYACGLRIDTLVLPVAGDVTMGVANLPLTVLWMVGITNAVNLIDGLDGLAGGIVLFASVTNFVVAILSHNPFVALAMVAVSGAVLGFLFFNFNPARIFMGDSGSYFLGFALSSAVLVGSESQKTSTAVGLVVPCLALGVPIFDTLFSIVRRFLERRPLFAPDRGHIHHRLLDLGLTQRRAVLVIYGLSIISCVTAVVLKLGREWHVGVAIAALCLAVVLFLRFAGYVEYVRLRLMRRGRIKSPMIEALRKALPAVPARFAVATTEDGIFEELRGIVDPLEIDVVEIVSAAGRVLPVFVRDPARRVLPDDTRATVQLGDDRRGQVTFMWPRSRGECTPDVEILLQVLIDMAMPHLSRVGSAWAKGVESAPPAAAPARPAAAPALPSLAASAAHVIDGSGR